MKMKRLVSLFLGVLMVFVMDTVSFAEFDLSVFEERKYLITHDEFEDLAIIDPVSMPVPASKIPYGTFRINPSIVILDTGEAFFRVLFSAYMEKWIFLNKIIIKIGEKKYYFEEEFSRGVRSGGYVKEELLFPLGNTGFSMIDEMRTASEVKIRMEGEKYFRDCVFSQKSIDLLLDFYDDFLKAGGSEKEYILDAVDEKYPINVR